MAPKKAAASKAAATTKTTTVVKKQEEHQIEDVLTKANIEQFVKKYYKPSPATALSDLAQGAGKRVDPLINLYEANPSDFPFVNDCGKGFDYIAAQSFANLSDKDQKNFITQLLILHANHIKFTPEYNGNAKILDTLTKIEIPCMFTELKTFFSGTTFTREYNRKLGPKIDHRLKEFQLKLKQQKQEKLEAQKRKQMANKTNNSDSDSDSDDDNGDDKPNKKQKTGDSNEDDNKLVQLGAKSRRVGAFGSSSDSDDDESSDEEIKAVKTAQTKVVTGQKKISFDSTSSSDSDSDGDDDEKPKSFSKKNKMQDVKQKSMMNYNGSDSSSDSDSDDDDNNNKKNNNKKNNKDKQPQESTSLTDGKPQPQQQKNKKPEEKRYIVFIGNLNRNTTKQDILEHFQEHNPIACRLLTHRDSGESRGTAFLEFSNHFDMQRVLQLEDVILDEKKLNISFAVGTRGSEKRKDLLKEKTQKLVQERAKHKEKMERIAAQQAGNDGDAADAPKRSRVRNRNRDRGNNNNDDDYDPAYFGEAPTPQKPAARMQSTTAQDGEDAPKPKRQRYRKNKEQKDDGESSQQQQQEKPKEKKEPELKIADLSNTKSSYLSAGGANKRMKFDE